MISLILAVGSSHLGRSCRSTSPSMFKPIVRFIYFIYYIHDFYTENGCNGREVEDKPSDSAVGLLTVEGQRKDLNTIFLKLRITDSKGFNLLFFK